MREIKFRVWDKRQTKGAQTKEMLYNAQNISLWHDFLDYPTTYAVMQFTGLKDKNNKEIYEGDILHFDDSSKNGDYYSVIFIDGAFKAKFKNPFFEVSYLNEGGHCFSHKVVGNIFENPNLLTD